MMFRKSVATLAVLACCADASNLRGAGRLLAASEFTQPDIDIMNFALTLECIEANYYNAYLNEGPLEDGASTTTMPEGDGPGAVTAGDITEAGPGPIAAEARAIAQELFENEMAHLNFLRGPLADSGISCPAINISPASFRAVLTSVVSPTTMTAAQIAAYDPYASELGFLAGALFLEDLGVTAYNGAAQLITAKAGLLGPAAAIHNAEAYHSGAIRSFLYENRALDVNEDATELVTVETLVNTFSAARAKLTSPTTPANGKDAGLTAAALFLVAPVDANGLVYERSVAEVLAVLRAGKAAAVGQFLPVDA